MHIWPSIVVRTSIMHSASSMDNGGCEVARFASLYFCDIYNEDKGNQKKDLARTFHRLDEVMKERSEELIQIRDSDVFFAEKDQQLRMIMESSPSSSTPKTDENAGDNNDDDSTRSCGEARSF